MFNINDDFVSVDGDCGDIDDALKKIHINHSKSFLAKI